MKSILNFITEESVFEKGMLFETKLLFGTDADKSTSANAGKKRILNKYFFISAKVLNSSQG